MSKSPAYPWCPTTLLWSTIPTMHQIRSFKKLKRTAKPGRASQAASTVLRIRKLLTDHQAIEHSPSQRECKSKHKQLCLPFYIHWSHSRHSLFHDHSSFTRGPIQPFLWYQSSIIRSACGIHEGNLVWKRQPMTASPQQIQHRWPCHQSTASTEQRYFEGSGG